MPPKRQRVYYWDTGIFVSLVSSHDNPEMQRIAKGLYNDARKGEIIIVTSYLTRAECRKHRGSSYTLTAQEHAAIGSYFQQPILMVTVEKYVSEKAAEFGEKYHLNTDDAIHLATAVVFNERKWYPDIPRIDEFHAWDGHFFEHYLLKNSPPIPIAHPVLTGAENQPLNF